MRHSRVHYRFAEVQQHKMFYREAGPKDAPAILLLHGFPTSSHMFRNLIPMLAERYRVIAPDLPGFGFTVSPSPFEHTFDHLAEVMDGFTAIIGMNRYAVYVFDYGAPVGFRLALEHPERILRSLRRMVMRTRKASAQASSDPGTLAGCLCGASHAR